VNTEKVTMILRGQSVPNYSEYFINSGTAKDIALNLAMQNNKGIVKNNDKLMTAVNKYNHNAEFALSARMVGYGNNITVGSFKSHLEFTLIYN
ncbi:type 1 fimbrial protein, partial [Proteus mirabilis]|nr:type 1 fimbrial protein [Proteus mirabilis]MBQ0645265.1 type 1 fimbrial protein [Proteus mirabilis]